MYKIVNYDERDGQAKTTNSFSDLNSALFFLPMINGRNDYKELLNDKDEVLYEYEDGIVKQVIPEI